MTVACNQKEGKEKKMIPVVRVQKFIFHDRKKEKDREKETEGKRKICLSSLSVYSIKNSLVMFAIGLARDIFTFTRKSTLNVLFCSALIYILIN